MINQAFVESLVRAGMQVLAGYLIGRGVIDALDGAGRVELESEQVTEVDDLEDRLQLVITVGAPPNDMQAKIELGRRTPPNEVRGGGDRPGVHGRTPCQSSISNRTRTPSRLTSMRRGSSRRVAGTGA